jgi:5-methylcytosine-specific restriction enzyme A
MAKLSSALSAKQRNWYDRRTYRPGRRTFSNEVKRLAWKRCKKQCQGCTAPVTGAGDVVFDHVVPWELTRDSSLENCQVLCLTCDDLKTYRRDLPAIAQADRKADFHLGITGPGKGKCPLPGGRYDRDGNPGRVSKTMRHGVVARVSQADKHRRFMARRYENLRGGSNG